MKAIGERLLLTRQALGLTQSDFCEGASVSRNTYNQAERGKRRVSIDVAIALVKRYHLTLDWIYLGDPSQLHFGLAQAIKALQQAPAIPVKRGRRRK